MRLLKQRYFYAEPNGLTRFEIKKKLQDYHFSELKKFTLVSLGYDS